MAFPTKIIFDVGGFTGTGEVTRAEYSNSLTDGALFVTYHVPLAGILSEEMDELLATIRRSLEDYAAREGFTAVHSGLLGLHKPEESDDPTPPAYPSGYYDDEDDEDDNVSLWGFID